MVQYDPSTNPIAHITNVKPNTVKGMFRLVNFPRGERYSMWSGIACLTATETPAKYPASPVNVAEVNEGSFNH